ncbi:aspartate aminotransferase family protein [Limibacillus halophilus]|uniref:Acetylornithine aminotransferase n=1 Tax=Limibacillus halophilus TaxID=1579333 RepID=A0A839SVG2_9PROT|nr:aspartate aminotransferase family protein [Limibacillus halophilus]MBB3066298.1 acetylornithine/N-succinyldiaminopimelate aminotransferase [Limibacillus halophilus]
MISAVMPTYARADLAFERGEGAYLFTSDGRRYLDFAAGIAVNSLGHSHPHLVKALEEQGRRLWHCANLYRIPAGERLAERLVAASFADTVFFTNSGAEALECGIKMVRKYHDDTGSPGRYKIITCRGAFHGRTLTTISAAGNEKYMKGFLPEVPGFVHVAFGNLNELRAAIDDETAAILVEPVQGEGGIRPADLEYLRALRTICDEFGLLLFLDEVQCGMGRTGKLFAHEWAGITPDIVASAKGIGGGFPLGACLATEKAAVGMTAGTHGSTYGGNPLAMAVGNAVMDILLEEGFFQEVDRVGRHLWRELAALCDRNPEVLEEVRGAGLMLGLKCRVPNTDFGLQARELGLLTVVAAENVVRILPPLIIKEAEVKEAVAILEQTCKAMAKAA